MRIWSRVSTVIDGLRSATTEISISLPLIQNLQSLAPCNAIDIPHVKILPVFWEQEFFFHYFNFTVMAISQKYGRTYHYPFSPGTDSDDRIQYDYWQPLQQMQQIVHTEKLDGENNCLSRYGVFARSHAAPTTSAWTESLRIFWQRIRNELGTMEIFLENLYAIHSIEYRNIDHHFYVFAIRDRDQWLGWEETKFYAALLDLPVVPEISTGRPAAVRSDFEKEVMVLASGSGAFQPHDAKNGKAGYDGGDRNEELEWLQGGCLCRQCFQIRSQGTCKNR